MKSATAKIVKSVGDKNFEITLLQLESGSYCVLSIRNETETFSEPIRDLTNALYVFESKYLELQGH